MFFKRSAIIAIGIAPPTKFLASSAQIQAWSGIGCPPEWAEGSNYQPKEVAAVDGVVYQCSSQELLFVDRLCGLSSYKPGSSLYWEVAWEVLGSCDGDTPVRPTTSPPNVHLSNVGGCPREFSKYAKYEPGDQVEVDGIALQCKEWPYGALCNLFGFEPLGPKSDSAWSTLGYCDGTVSPSASPIFELLPNHEGCPAPHDPEVEYSANDKVSTQVNDVYSIVWKCESSMHLSRFCTQFEPGDESNLGWTIIGHCKGSMAPTTAPNFIHLISYGEGCPDEYNAHIQYETGDVVTHVKAPGRKVVYQCKDWPQNAYCNAGQLYAPGGYYDDLGWEVQGWCDGTTAPSSSPIVLTDACEDEPWTLDDLPWYDQGDRVRKEDRIYECRGWPYSLWCTNANYEPEASLHWKEAWLYVGECVTIDEATVSIEGTVSINISGRRSLEYIQGLGESEATDLISSTQDAVEDAACEGFPDKYVCIVDILSVNGQDLSRRLRQRDLLSGLLTFRWIAQITFQTQSNWANSQELANSASTSLSYNLNAAAEDNSLVAALVSYAGTSVVQNMSFGAASVVANSPRLELRRTSRDMGLSGSSRCKRDNQCASNRCTRGGGSCERWKKCCVPSVIVKKKGGDKCRKDYECASNECVRGGGSCGLLKKCCKPAPPTKKPSFKPTLYPTTATPTTASPTPNPTTATPTSSPSNTPTSSPSTSPTSSPTSKPTAHPTFAANNCICSQFDGNESMSSPLNDYEMGDGSGFILQPRSHQITSSGEVEVCYNDMFESVIGGPTTAQFLVMFDKHFVEHCGCIYAAPPPDYCEGLDHRRGLYAVNNGSSPSCVKFRLLYQDDNIGQIVASRQFDPINIIGVSGTTIYGYYVQNGVYNREPTIWGDAKDWTLDAHLDDDGLVTGLSSDGVLFTLYGSFNPQSADSSERNFNYAKHDNITCASSPASIDDWTGSFSGMRGTYCPGLGNSQLWKRTWHAEGETIDVLSGPPAAKVCVRVMCCFSAEEFTASRKLAQIARLGPSSNIYGISTTGGLIALMENNDSDPTISSISLSPPDSDLSDLVGIRALGGLDDTVSRGIFVVNEDDKVYNVYHEDGWKAQNIHVELSGMPLYGHSVLVRFGSYNGKVYMLEGWECIGIHCFSTVSATNGYQVNELVFSVESDRYRKELVSYSVYEFP